VDERSGLGHLGRVAVVDRHGGARRVLRAIGELVAAERAEASIAIHAPEHRFAPFVREADEAVELRGGLEDALRASRATTAWLGPAPLEERAAFADACARAGVVPVGPSAATLRRLVAPRALVDLGAELGLARESADEAREGSTPVAEVVVACDRAGTAAVLGTGDASLSLGEVAVVSESPALGLGALEDTARALAERALRAVGWTGVGVVRLGVPRRAGRLSLLAIDALARSAAALEEAAGIDLVRLSLRLAAGAPVDPLRAPPRRGHAVAARIQARDPEGDAARSGRVQRMRLPSGPGVRAHAALVEGDEAPAGAVLATVVAAADERAEALARLEQALSEADVLVRGTATSRAWLRGLLARPEVRAGAVGRGFLDGLERKDEELVRRNPDVALAEAAIEAYEAELELERARFVAEARRGRPRVGESSGRDVELRWRGRRYRLEVRQTGPDAYRVTPAGSAGVEVRVTRLGDAERRLRCFGRRWRILSAVDGQQHLVEVDGVPHAIRREPAGIIASPMPAIVVAIPVKPGDQVAAGDPIARIESMKVEMVVTAPAAGAVREVLTVANAQVDAGAPLVRVDPPGDLVPEASAPFEAPAGAAEPASARERYLGAIDELRRLALGFDVSPAEAKQLSARWRAMSDAVDRDDAEVLDAEEGAVRAFADVQALYARERPADGGRDGAPPLEELWRYLHEPERRGEGLSPWFVAALRGALSHYGLSLDEPGRALELALLRMQYAYERAAEPLAPVLAILERRLAGEGVPPGGGPRSRALLDALAAIGQERFPPLADLARELRYRRFDQPALEETRRAVYLQAEADLGRLAGASGEEREAIVERLVECPQPLATLLLSRAAEAPSALRARLVETLLRRYYRARPVAPAVADEVDGVAGVFADYAHAGEEFRIVACFGLLSDVERAVRRLARLVEEAPPGRLVAAELYLWHEGEPPAKDAQAEALRAALGRATFARPVRRVSAVVAVGGRGLGRQASQRHFTFTPAGGAFREERRYRGVHPMLFRRLQLVRLEKFELERLPSAEDVFLYRAVAQANPKDERLFAAAEVRDLTPARDEAGRIVQLPQLERVLHEALAGMRRFQAGRAPHERLEWNRVLLTVTPPLRLTREEVRALCERLAPATQGLGLEMVAIDARVPDRATGELRDTVVRVIAAPRGGVSIRWEAPTDRPLEPLGEYQQRVVQLRRRGLVHPFEIVRQLAPEEPQGPVPRGTFVEHDLDASGEALVPVKRAPGGNAANMVVGVVTSFTDRYPEGMKRVALLGDPSRAMGSLAEPECRRIAAAIALAGQLRVPLEWFAVSAGAKISMESGTENMDWISLVLRRIVEFTQRGGEINVVVTGINVGAQPYWNAEATMLMHTSGILVMTPGSAMVLTGKEALEYSGSVSGESNELIGGYDRIMGPNGQAQYQAASVGEAIQLLLRHYEHTYVAPGERCPRRARTGDPADRDVREYPHGPAGGAGFETVGDVFSQEKNPERKKPFDIRRVMHACVDQDHPPLERWRDLRGGDTAVVWDAHLGGWPVCLLGIESRPLPRLEFVPADGPELWSAGTLFPQSSKKLARALNAASGSRPVVVLANLSGFDGSPESMRRLQLEYGAEIGRAVVNFEGPIVFCVVSRYHGGAFVVFSKTLREDIEVVAVEGARASVIGGAPAAAVVFAREVEKRLRKDPRVVAAEKAAAADRAARARLDAIVTEVRSEKIGEVAVEFDAIHSVERALQVGSLDRIITARELRPYLVEAVGRRLEAAGNAAVTR
jgi:acetyl/propionyl-CoA carboxylase alpha subunit/acetyl-CoA carboxylase carboxyltransferase component